MNKNRRQLDKNVRKKINKNVKSAQAAYALREPPLLSDQLTPKEILKKYPKKIQMADKNALESELKRMAIKKKKTSPSQKHSKRTTPGEIEGRDAAPAHVHVESDRWNKTIRIQTAERNKVFTKKNLKRK